MKIRWLPRINQVQELKFTRVQMSDMQIIDHGSAAVVICNGEYETPAATQKLKFMRAWVKKPEGWRIVSGTVS